VARTILRHLYRLDVSVLVEGHAVDGEAALATDRAGLIAHL
jgi:hypothetical protein